MRRSRANNSEWKHPVRSISHPLLWFMLAYDKWPDFDGLKSFVEKSIREGREEVLTLHGALASSHRLLRTLRGFVRDMATKSSNRPEETVEIISFLREVGEWKPKWNWLVEGYIGLSSEKAAKQHIGEAPLATPVCQIGQAMENLYALMNDYPRADDITEEEYARLNRYFSLISQRKPVSDIHRELGFQSLSSFENWVRDHKVDIEFGRDDSICHDWEHARELLFSGQEESALKTGHNANTYGQPITPETEYSKDDRIFKNQGETWLCVYNGIPKSVKNSKGMKYICLLLQSSGQEIDASTLVYLAAGQERTPIIGSAGDAADAKALRDYRNRMSSIEKELEKANADNDLARIEKLTDNWEQLNKEISASTGLDGKSRKASSDRERHRKAVSIAIHRALKAIEEIHKPLWQHLRNSLRIGEFLTYQPDEFTSWTT